MKEHTPEYLHECLKADFEAGRLYWLHRPVSHFKTPAAAKMWNKKFAGKEAFTARHKRGYAIGAINNKGYLAHRIIWALAHGEWPNVIDHKNGDTTDNRLENLRNGTQQDNLRNPNLKAYSSTGFLGVYRHEKAFTAYLYGKYIGRFRCPTAANVARQKALANA